MQKLLVLVGLIVLSSPAFADEGHCRENEQVVFSCSVGKKTASVCASPESSQNIGYIQYRFGPIGAPEISYPENPSNFRKFTDTGLFQSKHTTGGWIRFTNGGYRYIAYSHEWQSDDGDNGGITQGVSVLKDGKRIAKLSCKSTATSDFYIPQQSGGLDDGSEEWSDEVEEVIGAFD